MENKSKNTDATNQMMGYKAQEYYALELLLRNRSYGRGYVVVEQIDDVCFIGHNEQYLYQLKHHNDKRNHITNSSIDFWKTIYNWMNKIKEGIIKDNDELNLIVFQKVGYDTDCYAKQMSQVKTEEEALEFYNIINSWYREEYKNKEVQQKNKNKKGKEILKYLDEIFKEENKSDLLSIIKRFKLNVFEKVDSLEDLIHKYIPGIKGTDYFDKIVAKVSKEFQIRFQNSYISHQKVKIDIKEFNQAIDKYIDKITTVYKFSHKTLKEDVEEKVCNSQNQNLKFVNQIKAFHLDDELILEETYNYFRAIKDIKNYMQEDLLTYEDYDTYRENQYGEWEGKRLIHFSDTIKDARIVFGECRGIKNKLSNEEMDVYFHMGNFHKMVEEQYKKFYWYKVDEENE